MRGDRRPCGGGIVALLAALTQVMACASAPPPARATTPAVAAVTCTIGGTEPWVGSWLRAWEFTSGTILKLPPATPPDLVFFDATCVYTTSARSASAVPGSSGPTLHGRSLAWRAASHTGTITMPDGNSAPAQLMSFAAAGDDGPFFTMAAPDIWAKAGVDSAEFGRDRMLTAVFLHEFSHVRQMSGFERILGPIDKSWKFPQELDDDVVQERFGGNADYAAAYQKERDLLYRAAGAATAAETRTLAAEALTMMNARHARWFTGENDVFRALDDVFLSFEGAGQWVAYAWLVHPGGGTAPRDTAIVGMRRGGRRWSQDEGLALFLVVDRLLPDWPSLVFGPTSIGARDLLEKALAQSSR